MINILHDTAIREAIDSIYIDNMNIQVVALYRSSMYKYNRLLQRMWRLWKNNKSDRIISGEVRHDDDNTHTQICQKDETTMC